MEHVRPEDNDDELVAIEEALDAIPAGELVELCAMFAEMTKNQPEPSARFLRVLGRMFSASIQRRYAGLDPDARAFVDAIAGSYTDDAAVEDYLKGQE